MLSYLVNNFVLSAFLFDQAVFFWLLFAFMCLVVEIGHPGLFFFLSFFFGALCAAGIALSGMSIASQGILFFTVTGIAFFVLRRWVYQYVHKSTKNNQTNVYALQGKRGVVLTTVKILHKGVVKIGGERWLAHSVDQRSIEA
jgi:membrane protein implicated in regulation of membrane protease activity